MLYVIVRSKETGLDFTTENDPPNDFVADDVLQIIMTNVQTEIEALTAALFGEGVVVYENLALRPE